MKSIKTIIALSFVLLFSTVCVQNASAVDTSNYTYFNCSSGPSSISVGPGYGTYSHLYTIVPDSYLSPGQSLVEIEASLSFDNNPQQFPFTNYMNASWVHEGTNTYIFIDSSDVLPYYYIDHTVSWNFYLILSGGSWVGYSYSNIPFVR